MTVDCEVIRDLLPLYADHVCSERSREMVETHLAECPACTALLQKMQASEIENGLMVEKESVIASGSQYLKRRSTLAGLIVSGLFMIPILICLIVDIASGHGLGWFFIVLTALLVGASLVVVPLLAPKDKAFWTFCAFCASLVLLLGVTCLYTRGRWFWIAASASLFGLGAIFLPFVVKAKPVKKLIGNASKALIVLALDAALLIQMMNAIYSTKGLSFNTLLLTIGTLCAVGLAVIEVLRKRGEQA